MATLFRSQSSTPKPPSPAPIDSLHPLPPSNSTASTSTAPSSASTPIAFNTSMFARDAAEHHTHNHHQHHPHTHQQQQHPVAQAQAQAKVLVQTQAQSQAHARDRLSHDGMPIASASDAPADLLSKEHPAISISNISAYAPSHPAARSMSIQSLVSSTSTTGGTSSFADDDASSIVSHTTTRNTEDDDDDPDRDLSSISVDIDDPDVRMAAEALGDLRADFVSSPKSVPNSPPPAQEERQEERRQQSMMEMIQGQNTFLGTAVRAGRSVYRGGKRYSPRFKYGAEMVERAAAPMTSVVSYAARTTGVESVLRRNLEARRLSSSASSQSQSTATSPSHSQPSSVSSTHATKRRKTTFEDNAMDVDPRSPDHEQPLTHKPATDVVSLNWQRRLMLSTAGVGVALSEESLKSLKYCLAWLRWANDHLDKVIMALRGVISEYDSDSKAGDGGGEAGGGGRGGATDDERSAELQQKIDSLRKDVIGTLKRVVDVVSTYAGGALPENARVVVKACITNLPRRWALAAKDDGTAAGSGAGSSKNSMAVVVRREEAGKRVLVLAREGLEMMHQVSAIVQMTLERAEEWCDRLGRRRPEDPDYGKVGWDTDMEMESVEGRKDR
ncbi:hypothetical protein TWF696_003709 [Orbilia brochopaga]|uniref:Opi1-domain-containing protein n=1 Tax=Orbilia brochopaga TaxID=3140254 RepID=A0AAV9V743_9PEZI